MEIMANLNEREMIEKYTLQASWNVVSYMNVSRTNKVMKRAQQEIVPR